MTTDKIVQKIKDKAFECVPLKNGDVIVYIYLSEIKETLAQFEIKDKNSILDSIPEGYTQIMQILKAVMDNNPEKAKRYAEKFIELHPDNRISKGFRNILDGKQGTVCLDESPNINANQDGYHHETGRNEE